MLTPVAVLPYWLRFGWEEAWAQMFAPARMIAETYPWACVVRHPLAHMHPVGWRAPTSARPDKDDLTPIARLTVAIPC